MIYLQLIEQIKEGIRNNPISMFVLDLSGFSELEKTLAIVILRASKVCLNCISCEWDDDKVVLGLDGSSNRDQSMETLYTFLGSITEDNIDAKLIEMQLKGLV